MKHGIYKGDVVEIAGISGKLVKVTADGDYMTAAEDEILLIPEDVFKRAEPELTAVKDEVKNLKTRMHNLDDAYRVRMEALRELMTAARQKEIAIVNKLIKASIMPEGEDEL